VLAVAGDCGAADYLTALSPVLASWRDSLVAWGDTFDLDTPPTYTEEQDPGDYLFQLVPVLQQWEMSLNADLGSEVLDSVPDFDPNETGVPEYLLGLSNLLVGWKTSLEGFRGQEFLPALPIFEPDTMPPMITCPADTTIGCADSSGVAVEFDGLVVAVDDCDPSPSISCDPPSGSTFMLGETVVTCTAVDSAGNSSECTFTVTIEEALPPVITCPEDTTVECTGDGSAVVEFEVPATSECDDTVDVVCDPPSGSTFELGETVVTCTATDDLGNTSECTFTVIVVDTEPPVITCPADTTLECTGDGGAMLEFAATATDICDSEPTVTCEPPSGSMFPLGETVVTCTATDASGNSSQCTFTVKVEDTTPPVINSAEPSKSRLWPPNHKMVEVSVSIDVEDVCDSTPTCQIIDVMSNEDINGRGDGNTEPDWIITGDLSVQLRAERAGGGSSRVYYLVVRCEDDSGNGAEHTVEVVVPHDQRDGLSLR